jgi:hypothetical protein
VEKQNDFHFPNAPSTIAACSFSCAFGKPVAGEAAARRLAHFQPYSLTFNNIPNFAQNVIS